MIGVDPAENRPQVTPIPGVTAPSHRKAALFILVATVVSGGAAYALTVLAGVRLGTVGYVPVGVFLSALYLVVTALGGVQQEVTRAARPRDIDAATAHRPVLRSFAVRFSVVVVAVLLITAPVWGARVFPDHGFSLVLPLVVGSAAYLLVATLAGVFYGLAHWYAVAALIAADGLIRLVLAGVALFFTDDPRVIAWMLVVPFVAVAVLAWPWTRHHVTGRFELDVGQRQLTWNVARTVVAATAMGVLVSGFPLLVAATSPTAEPGLVSSTMLAINLARAPLIVVAISFQGFLLTDFRRRASLRRPLARLLAATGVASLALAALGWSIGPRVFEGVFGPGFHLSRPLVASILLSGGLVAALCIAGVAALSRDQHGWYAAGWVASGVVAVGLLQLPIAYDSRVGLGLVVAPLVGVAIHLFALRSRGRQGR